MKFVRYLVYLLYSYYLNGPRRNTAYVSAILGLTFLIYLNLLTLSLFFEVDDHLPMSMNESKGSRYVKLLLFLSPIFFLLYYGVKEKRLEELKERLGYGHFEKEINHRVLLFTYFAVSFVMLVILSAKKKYGAG